MKPDLTIIHHFSRKVHFIFERLEKQEITSSQYAIRKTASAQKGRNKVINVPKVIAFDTLLLYNNTVIRDWQNKNRQAKKYT